MIKTTTGNLLHAHADALVNTVNCVGVMGKGIALQFKKAFPEMFKLYREDSKAGQVIPGRMHVFSTGSLVPPHYVINFPTKRHWRAKSRMSDIEDGLVDLVNQVHELGLRSLAIPPLGAGNGGLNWHEVRPKIVAAFEELPDVEILLYEPRGEPTKTPRSQPQLTLSRALFLCLMEQYKKADYSLTLLEIQKLAYFLQEAGQPLRLSFEPHRYGPYAQNLSQVLHDLEGHFLKGVVDTKPGTEIALMPGIGQDAVRFLGEDKRALERLETVTSLIEGFETPYGMELLSTVLWVVREHPSIASSPEMVTEHVHGWSERKRSLMRPEHVAVALERLHQQGWTAAKRS